MLRTAPTRAYIPALDVSRARKFYEQTVGLTPKEEYAGGVIYECGGAEVFMYPTSNAGDIQGKPGVLAGCRRGSRSGRTQGARRGIRGIRHARRDDEEQYRDRWWRQDGVVQGYRWKHSGDQPTPLSPGRLSGHFLPMTTPRVLNAARLRRTRVTRQYAIVEAPSVLGLRPTGVERLPDALIGAGFDTQLRARRVGRVEPPPYEYGRDPEILMLNPQGIADYTPKPADAIGEVLDTGDFPVVLGGDCSIVLGGLLALRRRCQEITGRRRGPQL
jgi:hypothetical protein